MTVHSKRNRRWRKAMLDAIKKAAHSSYYIHDSSLSDGLRVIRTFERVNNTEFDPFSSLHLMYVRGMGVHERLFRRLGIKPNSPQQQPPSSTPQ